MAQCRPTDTDAADRDAATAAAEIAHKGGRTFGFRVEADGSSVAYLPDHAPVEGLPPAVLALVGGVDVLLHDGQYLAPERSTAVAYGHSVVDDVLELAVRTGVRRLVLTHHAPDRTDDQLDRLAATMAGTALPVTLAVEGTEILV